MSSDLFYRMQFNDAEKFKVSVGFINPQRISQPNLVVKLRTDDLQIKGKSNKEKVKVIREMIKSRRLDMSTYIMAPYNFN